MFGPPAPTNEGTPTANPSPQGGRGIPAVRGEAGVTKKAVPGTEVGAWRRGVALTERT